MKFAIALLFVVAAVQARSTGVQVVNSQHGAAALGENPWVVHLRRAVSTSGHLESSVGALIAQRWVLTSAGGVRDARFIWVRLGVTQVISPELVLEVSTVTAHAEYNSTTGANNIALINLGRNVEPTANIAVIPLPAINFALGNSSRYCSFGGTQSKAAGEQLRCWDVSLHEFSNLVVVASGEGISAAQDSAGAPLVTDGALVGIQSRANVDGLAEFTLTSAYGEWISGMTGISVGRAPALEGTEVHFVN